jgi:hypothetical protein
LNLTLDHNEAYDVDGIHYNNGYHNKVKILQVVDGNVDSLVVVEDHKNGTDKDEDKEHSHECVDCDNVAWNDDDLEDKSDDDVASYSYSSFLSCRYESKCKELELIDY